jgi:hypothetical protein
MHTSRRMKSIQEFFLELIPLKLSKIALFTCQIIITLLVILIF